MTKEKSVDQQILDMYRRIVEKKHPDFVSGWPVISGYNVKTMSYRGWAIVILEHTGNSLMKSTIGSGEIAFGVVGVEQITDDNKALVRQRISRHFHLTRQDAVFILNERANVNQDLQRLLLQHEIEMGLCPMKIFLSHKGADKPMIHEYKRTLEFLGFEPWLDDDAMAAGAELERAILQGFKDSCAAVFFVTPNFKDEAYLATEVNYAIQQKREKGDRFSIITVVFSDGLNKGTVPELLKQYVWKEPRSDIEALREILRALPIQVGPVSWKEGA